MIKWFCVIKWNTRSTILCYFCAIHAEIVHPELVYYPSWVGVGTWNSSNQDPRGFVLKPGLSSTVLGKLGCDPFEVQAGRLAYREIGFLALENLTQNWGVTEIKEILSF